MIALKSEIEKLLETMPQEFDIEDIMYKLFVFDKLRAAEYDILHDNLIPNSEINKMVELWISK